MGMASQGCGGESTLGVFGSNWIWLIILIFFCCGGFGNDLGNVLGSNWFNGGDCTWLWIILAFYCCCRTPRRCC